MALSCTVCGAPIAPEAIGSDGLARCHHCDAITQLELKGPRRHRSQGPPPRPPVPMPPRFRLEDRGGRTHIRWRWPWRTRGLLGVALVLWALYGAYAWLGVVMELDEGPLSSSYPTFHGLLGLALVYVLVVSLVNRITLQAQRGALRITQGPLPWPKGKRLAGVEQLYSKRRELRQGENGTVFFELWAITRDRRQHKLVGGLDHPHQALWLERTLEERMGLEDRAVAGELPRH